MIGSVLLFLPISFVIFFLSCCLWWRFRHCWTFLIVSVESLTGSLSRFYRKLRRVWSVVTFSFYWIGFEVLKWTWSRASSGLNIPWDSYKTLPKLAMLCMTFENFPDTLLGMSKKVIWRFLLGKLTKIFFSN